MSVNFSPILPEHSSFTAPNTNFIHTSCKENQITLLYTYLECLAFLGDFSGESDSYLLDRKPNLSDELQTVSLIIIVIHYIHSH